MIIFSLILTLYNVIIYGDDIVIYYYFQGYLLWNKTKKLKKKIRVLLA